MTLRRKFLRRSTRWQRSRKPRLVAPLLLTASVAAGLAYSNSAQAADDFWLGPNGFANFNVAAYWSTGTVPGAGDDAINNNASAGIQLTDNQTVNSLLSAGQLLINSGTFSGSQANSASALQVNNTFTIDGGGISNFTVNAGSGGQGVTFTGNGNNFFSGVVFNSSLDFSNGGFAEAYNANTINNILNLGGGNVRLENSNASLTVGATGSIVGSGTVNQYNGGATLTNNGLINANLNGSTLALNLSNFSSTGTLQADNGGTLALNTGGNVSGTIQALNSGTVQINSALTSATSTTINASTGTVLVNGGGVSGAFTTTGNGLTFSGNGNNFIGYYLSPTTITGNLAFGSGFAELYNAITLNTGTLSLAGGLVRLDNSNSNLTLASDYTVAGYGTITQYNGGATLVNNGLINANVNGQTLGIGLSNFTSTGTLRADNGGILTLSSGINVSGTIEALNGSTVNVNNFLNSATGTTINASTGTVLVDSGGLSGTFTVNGSGLQFSNNGNNFIGYYLSPTTIKGNLAFGSGFAELYNAITLNTGTLSLAGGNIRLDNSNSNLTLASDYTIAGYGTINQYNGGATLVNNGLINANTSGQTLYVGLGNFTNNGTLRASNGSILTLASPITSNGTIEALNGSTVNVNTVLNSATGTTIHTDTGTVLIDSAGLNGNFTTTGTGLTFTGNGNNFIGRDVAASTLTGNLAFGSGFAEIYNADTFKTGTLSLAGGNLRLDNSNSNLTLASDYTLAGYGTINQYNGGANLINNGLINANVSGQTLNIGLDNFANTGTLEATNGGNLTVNSQLTDSGIIQATGGSTLTINRLLTANNDVIHGDTGTVLIDNAAVTGTITSATGTGLTFSNSGGNYLSSVTLNSGALTFNPTSFAELYNTLDLKGTLNLSSDSTGVSNLRLDNSNSLLLVDSAGQVVGAGTINQYNGGATVTNNGFINANQNGKTLAISLGNFNNTATAQATNGATLAISSATNLSGILQAVGSGSQVTLTGTLTGSNGTINSGAGTVLADNLGVTGSFNTTGTGLTFSGSGGNYLSNTAFTGNLTFGAGSFAELFNANTLQAGTLSLAGGNLRLENSNSNLTLASDYTVAGYGTVNQYNGGATLTNNGTVNANVNGQTLTVGLDNITGGGTFQANNSTLAINSGNIASTNANIQAVNSGAVNINGNLTGSNFQVDAAGGSVQFSGGLTGSIGNSTGAGLSFTSSGGNYLSGAVVNSGGIVTFGSGSFAEGYGTNAINGTLAMSGGNIRLENSNSNLVIGASGNLTGYGTINQFNGGATFTNNGTVNANTSGQTLTLSPSNVANTGKINVAVSSTLSAPNGITQTAGTTQTDGTLAVGQTFALQGGTLRGTGTIQGDVNNTGGTFKPGDVGPGTLTQTGNYGQSASGIFLEQLGGTTAGSFGVFNVSDIVSLDGTLDVKLTNGFHPVVNDTFTFINYGDRHNSAFASVDSLDTGFAYSVLYDDVSKTATLRVIQAAPVPETGTIVSMSLMLGLGGWALRRRRSQDKKNVATSTGSMAQ